MRWRVASATTAETAEANAQTAPPAPRPRGPAIAAQPAMLGPSRCRCRVGAGKLQFITARRLVLDSASDLSGRACGQKAGVFFRCGARMLPHLVRHGSNPVHKGPMAVHAHKVRLRHGPPSGRSS